MMTAKKPFYRIYLEMVMNTRCRKNTAYSLRAFARSLEINASVLSRIMAGKRPLSIRTAKRLAQLLNLTPEDAKLFLRSCAKEQEQRKLRKVLPDISQSAINGVKEISGDDFQAIAEMYHIAILELTEVENFSPDPLWIAKTLGIPTNEAQMALDRLETLGFLKRVNGRLQKTNEHLHSKEPDKTCQALKLYQEQILRGAIKSLRNDSIDLRNMSSMTMAIDPAKLPTAKLMIHEFMDELCRYLEAGTRHQVYQLGVTLYPIQGSESQQQTFDLQ